MRNSRNVFVEKRSVKLVTELDMLPIRSFFFHFFSVFFFLSAISFHCSRLFTLLAFSFEVNSLLSKLDKNFRHQNQFPAKSTPRR